MAMRIALSAKLAQGKIVFCDEIQGVNKTKEMRAIIESKGWKSALLVDEVVDNDIVLSTSNLYHVDVLPQIGLNVYDMLRNDVLVLTKSAVEKLQSRLL